MADPFTPYLLLFATQIVVAMIYAGGFVIGCWLISKGTYVNVTVEDDAEE